ncbi:expressed unknown protein [Seminavis robusta]|uniref:Uncharacterized protein n=1 Tax=Seminavis robusta TaxID=568900 RepID=A0A9N8HSS1_9STRA|nr:expressed unknown protein [Seminavis robusta]|eukprot:Sro1195_g251360.1 n/a (431) ;mRNA; r:5171-6463
MRQRAAVAATPPRSAESDHGQWQHQPRQRSSYHHPADSRSLSVRQLDTGADGIVTDGTVAAAEAVRRRRGHPLTNQTNHFHQTATTVERHSPQHYMAEYNKNYGLDITTSASVESITAPHSTGGIPTISTTSTSSAATYTHHGATGYSSTAASEIYYNQYYGSNHQQHHNNNHQHHSRSSSYDENNPALRRNSASLPNAHKLSFQHFERSFHMDPNPLAAVHFRTALHVPDNQYRAFLHGKGRDTTPVLNPICCANTCAGFSFVGFLFLVFIGILLDTQPLFISGTLPSAIKEYDGGKTATIYFVTAERLPSSSNAYQASFAYLATLLACLYYVHNERLDKRRAYQDIPDAASTAGMVGGDVLPEVVMNTATGEPGYRVSAWNRLASATVTVRAREWVGAAAARIWNGRGAPNNPRAGRKMRTKTCAKTV